MDTQPPPKKLKQDPITQIARTLQSLEVKNRDSPRDNWGHGDWLGDYVDDLQPGKGLILSGDHEADPSKANEDDEVVDDEAVEEDEAEEESDGDDDDDGGGRIVHVRGKEYHVNQYFGRSWLEHIEKLFQVDPMPTPPNMTLVPHEYQRKGAAQADYLCRSIFRGMICGDAMGVGKTLLAILAMWLAKDEPGFSLVVAPKSVNHQWKQLIESAWDEGHGLRVLLLEDSTMTAHELNAAAYDVVICSYDFVETSMRAMRDLPDRLKHWTAHHAGGSIDLPQRPVSALHSKMWREINLPFKRLILDEVQVANKRKGARHTAIKNLFVTGTIVLSGTLAHNRWEDLSGVVDFVRGHPISSDRIFTQVFGTREGRKLTIDIKGMHLLRRFLQAFTIIRPSTIVTPVRCRRWVYQFSLLDAHADEVDRLMVSYKQAARSTASNRSNLQFTYAVKAQLMSIHPLLRESDDAVADAAYDPDALYTNEETEISNEDRAQWLERVRASETLCEDSERLKALLRLYWSLRAQAPGRKVIIFSRYLKFLDIVDEAFLHKFQVQCLRYDGTIMPSQRHSIEVKFAAPENQKPLLITAGAGGVGLNITAASIVIQTEVWWNHNTELQALCRVFRQGQTANVDAYRIEGDNSSVDMEMKTVQEGKTEVNEILMRNLIRRHDEKPIIEDLLHPDPTTSDSD